MCLGAGREAPEPHFEASGRHVGTVLTVSSRALVGACARPGLGTRARVRAVGTSRKPLEDPDARLEGSQAGAPWTQAFAGELAAGRRGHHRMGSAE
jgi:hypothetical protein